MKETAIRLGLLGVSGLSLLGIGIYAAQLIWLIFSGVDEPEFKPITPTTDGSSAQRLSVDVSKIQSWHLFGQQTAVEVVVPVQEAPKTTLKLELLGVFLGIEGAPSSAIIGELGKDPDYFKVGDTIARGVTLEEVYRNKVILNRNGSFETLEFTESIGGGVSIARPPPESSPSQQFSEARRRFLNRSSTVNSGSSENSAEAQSQLGRMVQSGNAYGPQAIISALQQDLEQNPEEAINDMGLISTPGTAGYLISASAPADLLRTIGLRVGDRVMSVDGQAISGSANNSALIQAAMQKNNVRVEVQRGTRTFTVNVQVPK